MRDLFYGLLWPVVYAFAQWGEHRFSPGGPRRVVSHVTCGRDLTSSSWCSTCRLTPGPAGLVIDKISGTRMDGHLDLGPEHHTPWGIVHGGIYTTAVETPRAAPRSSPSRCTRAATSGCGS